MSLRKEKVRVEKKEGRRKGRKRRKIRKENEKEKGGGNATGDMEIETGIIPVSKISSQHLKKHGSIFRYLAQFYKIEK